MKNKLIVKVIAIVLAIAMPVVTATVTLASAGDESTASTKTKYESMDINSLTGHGEEPEDLSVSADATYQEKAWYEYVQYSDKAVSSYKLADDKRLLFYDPYTYTNSMIMDVEFNAKTTEFDTMSSYTISHTNTKSIDACISSTDTYTSAVQTSGRDETHSFVENNGNTTTIYNHSIDNPTYGTVTEEIKKDYSEYRYKTTTTQDGSTTSGGGGTKNLMGTIMNTMTGALTGGIVGGLIGLASGLEVSADYSKTHSESTTDNAAIVLDKETKTNI